MRVISPSRAPPSARPRPEAAAGTGGEAYVADLVAFEGEGGVTCANASSASSAERRVEQLRLAGQDLVGTLPAKLAELTRLKLLDLGENMLEGPVPLELGKMGEAWRR